jgi:hypothetical protein
VESELNTKLNMELLSEMTQNVLAFCWEIIISEVQTGPLQRFRLSWFARLE